MSNISKNTGEWDLYRKVKNINREGKVGRLSQNKGVYQTNQVKYYSQISGKTHNCTETFALVTIIPIHSAQAINIANSKVINDQNIITLSRSERHKPTPLSYPSRPSSLVHVE